MIEFSRITRSRWFRPAAIVGGLLVAALMVPFILPLRGYIPEVIATASLRIGQPVNVADMRLKILPTPRVALYGIEVGKGAPLQIDELQVVPALFSLLGEHKAIRLVRAHGVRIREPALAIVGKLPKSKKTQEGAPPVRIESLELRDVSFQTRAMKVPDFDLWVDLTDRYAPKSARFRTGDRALEVALDPLAQGGARVVLDARNWKLPFRSAPLTFESLVANGTLNDGVLDFPELKGTLYGGTLIGTFRLDWLRNWRLEGRADIARIDLSPMLRDLGKPGKLSGRLNAKAVFSSHAGTAGQLGEALALDAPAEVTGGAWHGVDLSRVVELPFGKLAAGGKTPFEELRGTVSLRGKTLRVDEICARSPTLVAGGNAEVAPDNALSGELDVSVAKTGGIVGVPVALGGTVSEASIGLTRAATIGAVLGTLVLPGVGTTLGATAGGKLATKSGCK